MEESSSTTDFSVSHQDAAIKAEPIRYRNTGKLKFESDVLNRSTEKPAANKRLLSEGGKPAAKRQLLIHSEATTELKYGTSLSVSDHGEAYEYSDNLATYTPESCELRGSHELEHHDIQDQTSIFQETSECSSAVVNVASEASSKYSEDDHRSPSRLSDHSQGTSNPFLSSSYSVGDMYQGRRFLSWEEGRAQEGRHPASSICLGDPKNMSPVGTMDVKFLTSHTKEFTDYINVKALLPLLLSKQLFTLDEEEYLLSPCHTREDKILQLLFYLKTKGPNGLRLFLSAIKEEKTHIGHEQLYERLMEDLMPSECINTQELLKDKLVSRYTKKNWSKNVCSGPNTKIELFVKLALVRKAKLNEKEKATNEFIRSTLHGLLDDIEKKKQLIELENLFNDEEDTSEKLLVEGSPGIGKTKLACYLSSMWAKGKLLQKYKLVIFVQLRRFQKKELCIHDLIKHYLPGEKGKIIAGKLADSGCKNTLLILDGWDELASDLRNELSYFHDIVSGISCEFENASVMVTSRCTVSSELRRLVDKHVEVLGFDTEQVEKYVSSILPKNKADMVFSHFRKFPNIQALSHIPLTLSIICSILEDTDTLPSTLAPLYDLYTRKILLTNLKKHEEYKDISGLPSLSDLPGAKLQNLFKSLACLAWEGILNNCLVFTRKHLEDVRIINIQTDFDAYGLLNLCPYNDGAGVSHLYQFCHLTVQEFMAARHIAELEQNQRLSLLDKYRLDRKYRVVWKFFAGLTNLSDENTRDAIISTTRLKNNMDIVLLLHCLYEANDPNVCITAADYLNRELHLDNMSLNPTDCLCLAYTLAQTGGKWTLNMRCCNVGSTGLDILCSNLLLWQQKSSKVVPLSFARIDLTHNHLHLDNSPSGINKVAKLLSNQFIIEDLALDSNAFGDGQIGVLAQAMCSNKKITSLSLLRCEITHSGAKDLANILVQNTSLGSLSLRWNNIGDDGAKHIAEALKTNSTLVQLQLGNNNIKEDGFKHLCEMLKTNCGLKDLRLELVKVGIEQCKQVVEILPHNKHLELLDLTKSELGDNGLRILADGIKSNPGTSLKRFCFFGCGITDNGIKVIGDLIADERLTGLQLGCNPGITDASVPILLKVLENSRNLRCIRLEKCSISEAGQHDLEKLEHLEVTFVANIHLERIMRGIETDSRGCITKKHCSF